MPIPIQSNHMQIYKHEYTRIIQITQSCYAILQLNIKISSLGLMIKHEQFNLNHSTKHIFSQKYILEHCFGNSETLGYHSRKSQLNGSLSEPEIHGHSLPIVYQANIQHTNQRKPHPNSPYPLYFLDCHGW